MRDFFTINGEPSTRYNTFVAKVNHMDAPERDYSEIEVPGRNGTLITDNGRYKNIEQNYECYIRDNVDTNAMALRNWLLSYTGYQRIEDTFHPGEYRLGIVRGAFSMDVSDRKRGAVTVAFNCKPQIFLKSGEEEKTFTASGSIFNPTSCVAKPLLRIYGAGTITVNGKRVTFTGNTSYVDVDCDLQDAYYISQNMNSYITLPDYDFPILSPGTNTITLGAGVTRAIITPRWWHL